MKSSDKSAKTLAIIGSAIVASIAATSVSAGENPFAIKSLSSGYMVADADKAQEGKCGAGKCSAAEMNAMEDKAKEGSASTDKAKEASCSADKAKEGSCHADKK
jgi:uncharacterized low-complexity protein